MNPVNALRPLAFGLALTVACLVAGCRGNKEPAPRLGPVKATSLADGSYHAEETVWPVVAKVKVIVTDGRISDIMLSGHRAWKGKDAGPIIVKRILDKQNTKVDAVTGATMSSDAIMRAVQKALDQAVE